jgi:hypothetical protein
MFIAQATSLTFAMQAKSYGCEMCYTQIGSSLTNNTLDKIEIFATCKHSSLFWQSSEEKAFYVLLLNN